MNTGGTLWATIDSLPAGFAGGVKVATGQAILVVGRPHINGQVMACNGMSVGSTTAWLPMFFNFNHPAASIGHLLYVLTFKKFPKSAWLA